MVGRLVVLLVVGGVVAIASTQPASAATFTVTSIADPGSGGCTVGECTLREAIDLANSPSNPGKDTIGFDIPGSGPHTIAPVSDLPAITESVVIDGRTQDPLSPRPVIQLRGDDVPIFFFEGHGLRLQAGDSLVQGLVINCFFFAGVTIEAGDGSQLVANFIGTDISGETAAACDPPRVQGEGIHVKAGSDHLIGGLTPEDRNIISGNGRNIFMEPASPSGPGSTIQGNYIGTDKDGETALGGGAGIHLKSSENVIGGANAGTRNVISGNTTNILIESPEAGVVSNNRIQGNYIGTDATGEVALGGAGINASGIHHRVEGGEAGARQVIFGGASLAGSGHEIVGNLIGTDKDGTDALPTSFSGGLGVSGFNNTILRNVISGNLGDGLDLYSDCGDAIDCQGIGIVQGNKIGVDLTGTKPLGNGGSGIAADGPDGGLIGGTTASERNIISANGGVGVGFGSRYRLQGNYIGTDVNGQGVPFGQPGSFGNREIGVACCEGSVLVGGLAAGAGNLIAFNGGTGVFVDGPSSQASILGNSIYQNGILGIDIWPVDGPNTNDPGDGDSGANDFQNFPVITDVSVSGDQTVVKAALNSTRQTTFRLEFFRNRTCDERYPGQSSSFGEGQTFVGAEQVTTDSNGDWEGTVTLSGPTEPNEVITATATHFGDDPQVSLVGATSEFSECLAVGDEPRGTIVVEKRTQPGGDPQHFAFSGDAAGTIADGERITVAGLASGTYASTETVPSGWDLASIRCDDSDSSGDFGTAKATFRVAAGEKVVCTFTNAKRGMVIVPKTVSGSPISSLLPPEQQSFTFQLRKDASTTSAGTLIEQADANVANGGVVNFAAKLVANSPYQLCEIVMPGWRTSLAMPFVLYSPSGDNSTLCTNFSVAPSETQSITVDNQPPPGGFARTIGFWKNWASCASSGGNQRPVLDQTLAAAEPEGITIGMLTLHGSASSPNAAPNCLKAVRLLNKSRIDTGKKMASDPAFNLAAQQLAAALNVKAGALTCPNVIDAIEDAQALLAAVHFDGITHDRLSAAQTTQANSLATTLDRYNNNLLC
jgi:CSLREA domain-containing protein